MIFDGWGDTVRYLNFDFDSWTDISGTTFNGLETIYFVNHTFACNSINCAWRKRKCF